MFIRLPNGVRYLKLPEDIVTRGWSNDPKHFERSSLPEPEDQPDFNFPPGPHILILAQPRDDVFLIQSGETFYFWGALAMVLQRIDAPKALTEIIHRLKTNGAIEMTVLCDDLLF